MEYCREKGKSPSCSHNWNEAEKAYNLRNKKPEGRSLYHKMVMNEARKN